MTKESIVNFRTKYKGKPCVYIIDNEHNFFDNVPDQIPPIWNDATEEVYFIQTNQEFSGMSSRSFPYNITITNYDHIQQVKCLASREDVLSFIQSNKAKFTDEGYKYVLDLISIGFKNSGPGAKKYY